MKVKFIYDVLLISMFIRMKSTQEPRAETSALFSILFHQNTPRIYLAAAVLSHLTA